MIPLPTLTDPKTIHGMREDDPLKFRHIELEINTACDLACFGCDRFSDVTSAPNMTVEQVKRFVDESLDLKWRWERIRLLGGEPTLHPKFRECVSEIVRYRKHNTANHPAQPVVFLQVLTNGLGKSAIYREELKAQGISLHAEQKQKGVEPIWFNNTRLTPVDRDPNVGELQPCGIFGPHGCGLGLTRHGYFLDGAGASIARVAGHDIGIMNLKDVTWEAMLEQAKILCRICGHWNDPAPGAPIVVQKVRDTGLVTGAFWTNALRAYKARRPVLRVYGEST